MKILEICPFSAGGCGVWGRVLNESREFIKLGHKVMVFSSDIVKGSQERAKCEEEIQSVKINRFQSKQNFLSKNVHKFDFEAKFLELKPDIVITHLLHPHSFKALNLCLKNKIPCYLVTHAPFNVKRRFPLNFVTGLYYQFKVKQIINKFTKIITITAWELPYLMKLGVKKDKIVYIPNGLPEEFFRKKLNFNGNGVLFLGRIAPVKNLEILLNAAKLLPQINFTLVGPAEEDYLNKINCIIKKENINNVKIYPPVYDLIKKIKLIDKHKIFSLPSKREAMPQTLIEAMARGKIVISSRTDGGKEIIKNKENGFLFEIGDYEQLAKLIKENIHGSKLIEKNAAKEAEKYLWSKLIKKYIALFEK